jgi:hypothetical protein
VAMGNNTSEEPVKSFGSKLCLDHDESSPLVRRIARVLSCTLVSYLHSAQVTIPVLSFHGWSRSFFSSIEAQICKDYTDFDVSVFICGLLLMLLQLFLLLISIRPSNIGTRSFITMMMSFPNCNSPSQFILPSCLRFSVSVQVPRFNHFAFQSMFLSSFSPVHFQVRQAACIPIPVLCSVYTARFSCFIRYLLGGIVSSLIQHPAHE